jgi:hypothetical protein
MSPYGPDRSLLPSIEIYVDPLYRDAWHDDRNLLDYIDSKKMPAIIRYSDIEDEIIFPPSLSEGKWYKLDDSLRHKMSQADYNKAQKEGN